MSALGGTGHYLDRLEHLYEVSKLFLTFEDIEHTLDAALAVISETLPLRSAIVIEEAEGNRRMVVWGAADRTAGQMATAKAHVRAASAYFASDRSDTLQEQSGHTPLPVPATTVEPDPSQTFIVIPLVVGRARVFGVFQVESATALDRADLTFVNAVANQLAVAVDRYDARRHSEEVLHQAVRAREWLLQTVAHDLRSPLATIQLTVHALMADMPANDRRRGNKLRVEIIDRSARQLKRLIDDLVDFAGIQAGRLVLRLAAQDPESLLLEAVSSAEGVAHTKQLHLTSEILGQLPAVRCDRDRILQVLGNLIGNALNVTRSGGSIVLRAQASGSGPLFSVSDTGPGIPPEQLEQLFVPYWRGDRVGYQGTGLGLAIARGIVSAHGGEIWAESTVGTGSTFSFSIGGTGSPKNPGPRSTGQASMPG